MQRDEFNFSNYAEHIRRTHFFLVLFSVALIFALNINQPNDLERIYKKLLEVKYAVDHWDDLWLQKYADELTGYKLNRYLIIDKNELNKTGYNFKEPIVLQPKSNSGQELFSWKSRHSLRDKKEIPSIFEERKRGYFNAKNVRHFEGIGVPKPINLADFEKLWKNLGLVDEISFVEEVHENVIFYAACGKKYDEFMHNINKNKGLEAYKPEPINLKIREIVKKDKRGRTHGGMVKQLGATINSEERGIFSSWPKGFWQVYSLCISQRKTLDHPNRVPPFNEVKYVDEAEIDEKIKNSPYLDQYKYEFQFLIPIHIKIIKLPVRLRDRLTADLNLPWRDNDFLDAFPEFSVISDDLKLLPIDNMLSHYRWLIKNKVEPLVVAGFKFPISSVTNSGLLLLASILAYLVGHLRRLKYLLSTNNTGLFSPVLIFYPDSYSQVLSAFTFVLLPVSAGCLSVYHSILSGGGLVTSIIQVASALAIFVLAIKAYVIARHIASCNRGV